MKELTLSPNHIEDSYGLLNEAASQSHYNEGLYIPERSDVPRPDFESFVLGMVKPPDYQNGRYTIRPSQSDLVQHFAGLRGFAVIRTQNQTIAAPAIVLGDGGRLALLTAEVSADSISTTQHALLEAEYIKDEVNVSGQHSERDVTNAGEIAPSLLVASSGIHSNAHTDMHGLAGDKLQTFGTNFSGDGRQDISIGHDTRFVRSTVIAANRAIFLTGERDQLPQEESLFGLRLSAGELAVGMTLAASQSRDVDINLMANLARMTGQ
jgi:hypothetical protein